MKIHQPHSTHHCKSCLKSTGMLLMLLTLATVPPRSNAQNIDLANPGTNNIPVITGFTPLSFFNPTLFPAGDINNDNFADILVSSPRHTISGAIAGRGNLILGGPSFSDLDLLSFDNSNVRGAYYRDPGNSTIGSNMASAGDVNNDGYDDFIVTANFGSAYLVYGTPTPANYNLADITTSNINGFKITGQVTGSAGIGDINNDGFDDIAVAYTFYSAPSSNSNGRIYIIYGRTSSTNIDLSTFVSSPANGFTITGDSNQLIGRDFGSAGDFNNDGIDDLLIGTGISLIITAGSTTKIPTAAIVIKGKTGHYGDIDYIESPGILTPENAIAIFSSLPSYIPEFNSGNPSTYRDFNGDGFSDVFIASKNSNPDGATGAGAVYVVYGRDDATTFILQSTINTSTTNGVRIDGIAGEKLGTSCAWAGDINNDNLADLVINGPIASNNGLANSGSTYVVYGRAGATQPIDLASNFTYGTDGYRIDGPIADPVLTPTVAAAGDINADGFDDFLIGSTFEQLPYPASKAYLIYGKSAEPAGATNWMYY